MENAEELKLGMATAEAHLLATFLATLFLGFNVVLCVICTRILINRRKNGVANSGRLISATLLQLSICIGHAATYLWAALQAYIHYGEEPYGAARYFNTHWAVGSKAAQLMFFAANDVCYNAILIWRCHVVLTSNWRYSLPLAVVASASAAGGFGTALRVAIMPDDTALNPFFCAVDPYLTLFNSTSCAVQVVASSLIAWKVWTVLARDAEHKPRSCGIFVVGAEYAALRIIIESGVMRTVCGVLLLPLVWKHNVAGVIVSAVSTQVDATASYLIIIRTDTLRSGHRQGPRTTNFLTDVRLDSIQLNDVAKSQEVRQHHATINSVQGSLA